MSKEYDRGCLCKRHKKSVIEMTHYEMIEFIGALASAIETLDDKFKKVQAIAEKKEFDSALVANGLADTAWLAEYRYVGGSLWLNAEGRLVTATTALRFARKQDAEAFIKQAVKEAVVPMGMCIATEHLWEPPDANT